VNRHQRRADAKKAGKPFVKAVVTLHTAPEDVPTALLATWMAAASYGYTAAYAVPGTSWPVHIVVEMGGKKVCGTVEPSTGEAPAGGEPILKSGACLS
jgi:hypothetical protein